jgi:hypothetical protein
MSSKVFCCIFMVLFLIQITKQSNIDESDLNELKKLNQILSNQLYILKLKNALDEQQELDKYQKRQIPNKRKTLKIKLNQKPQQHRLFIG